MENISIKDPETGKKIELEISPEEFNKQQAWRVKFDGKEALIGIDQHGIWKQFESDSLDSSLVESIGNAIDARE